MLFGVAGIVAVKFFLFVCRFALFLGAIGCAEIEFERCIECAPANQAFYSYMLGEFGLGTRDSSFIHGDENDIDSD